ncbi:COMM domain-containing protein 4-like [Clavelina lepadiformis]|uniref:COMM domain-containing protein n=1 Tax=Clavelina lepadiformis TaxID=159417 RepID=A0ABP0H3D5_CLALP
MRFRFCGDLDCPDWVLAEINILARLTSVKMKLLVGQVIKGLLEEGIDFDKVEKITSDAKYDVGDIKASIAGLQFILSSAAKHDVEGDTLSSELQQLGLPKEHSLGLCKTYESKLAALRQEFLRKSFRKTSCLQNVDWKINPTTGATKNRTIDFRLILKDPTTGKNEVIEITANETKFQVLLHEMKQVQSQMHQLDL